MPGPFLFNYTFVDNDQEKYITYDLLDERTIIHHVLDVSGRTKTFLWLESAQDWLLSYAQPKSQCDVYAVVDLSRFVMIMSFFSATLLSFFQKSQCHMK